MSHRLPYAQAIIAVYPRANWARWMVIGVDGGDDGHRGPARPAHQLAPAAVRQADGEDAEEGRRKPQAEDVVPPVERGVHDQVVERRPVPVPDRHVQHVARARLARDVQRHDLVVVQRPEVEPEPDDENGVAHDGGTAQERGPSSGHKSPHLDAREHRRGIIGQRGRRGPPVPLRDGRRPPRERGRSRARRGGHGGAALTAGSSRRSTGAGIPGEVIFVDDGSTDATFERLSRPARLGPAPAGGVVRSQLRPAPGDARRHHARPRRDRGHDGRRPPERAVGHPPARRGGRGRGRRRIRPPPGQGRPHAPAAPLGRDQPHAGPPHRRRPVGLRLRVQRLPARRARPGDAPDRQAEVHQGHRLLDGRDRRRGRPRAPGPRGAEPLPPDRPHQDGPPGDHRVLARALAAGGAPLWQLSVSFRASVSGCGAWSSGSRTAARPASRSSERWSCSCWASTAP